MGTTEGQRYPWERQEGEGDAPWVGFEIFRELGPGRNLTTVSERTGCSYGRTRKYSSAWNWTKRAQAWDDYVARQADEAVVEEACDLRREHLRQLASIRKKALDRLEEIADQDGLSEKAAVKLFLEGVKLERLVSGGSTENVDVRQRPDLSGLSAEDLARLRELKRKADGGSGDE